MKRTEKIGRTKWNVETKAEGEEGKRVKDREKRRYRTNKQMSIKQKVNKK